MEVFEVAAFTLLTLAVVIGLRTYVYIKDLWSRLDSSQEEKAKFQKSAADKSRILVIKNKDLDKLWKENTLLKENVKYLTEGNKRLHSQLMTIKRQRAMEFTESLEKDKKVKFLSDENESLRLQLTTIKKPIAVVLMQNLEMEEKVKLLSDENKSLYSQLMTIKEQKAVEFMRNLEMEKTAAQQRESEYSKKLMDEEANLQERLHEIDELKQQAEDSKLCVICGEDERSLAFMPCGHFCSCKMCFANLRKRICPVCRQQIRSTRLIYM